MLSSDLPAGADPDESRPWERPGALRRDCEPHRGGMLRGLATAGLILPLAGLLLAPLVGFVAGVSVGLTVWVLAGRDLAKMDAGRMDPDGRRLTQSARRLGLAGVLVSLGALALGGLIVAAFLVLVGR
jgi:hypothetical protein